MPVENLSNSNSYMLYNFTAVLIKCCIEENNNSSKVRLFFRNTAK